MSATRDKTRMVSRRGKEVRFLIGSILCCLLLALFFRFGGHLIGYLDRGATYSRRLLGGRLSDRHDMLLYLSLDGPVPMNLASGNPLLFHNLPVVRGVLGQARRFADSKGALLHTDVSLGRIPSAGGTVAFWCRPLAKSSPDDSRVFWCSKNHAVLGIHLIGGELEILCSGKNGLNAIRAPFPFDGRFHHIAVTILPDRFLLYLDGREKASGALPGGFVPPLHHIYLGENPRAFLSADLDDVAIWTRPFDEKEIARLYHAKLPLPFRYEPLVYTAYHVLDTGCSCLRGFFRVIDRMMPHGEAFAPLRSDIPALEMRLSKKDARHFRNGYEKTILRGERTWKASRFRKVALVHGGHSEDVEICLDDLGEFEEPPPRPSFQIGAPVGFLAPGESGFFRLYPLERYEVFHPDAGFPLPLSREKIVRLFIDGDFLGFYQLESLDRQGSAWLLSGKRLPNRTDFLLFDSQPTMSTEEKLLTEKAASRRFQEMASLLRSDMRFPWSPQEIQWRKNRHAARRASMRFAPPALTAADLKGGNPSALHLVTNLDLSPCGEDVVWTSSNPAVLGDDGRVSRPDGEIPVAVDLTGRFPDGSRKVFRFRVMPLEPRLASLHLHFSLPIEKVLDRDFTCQRFPEGQGAPQWLTGMVGSGSGAHHRGNTSYVRAAKRSMSIEFDQSVAAGVTDKPSRHLLLLSGYADPTRLRNKLAFDVFHLMRGTAVRRSACVSWNEVYVNGEYAGVWEIASRLQDVASAPFSDMYKVRALNALWFTTEPDFLTIVGKPPFPREAFSDVEALSRFVIESDRETFLAGFDDHFDRDALADFLLLINMTGNLDGRVTNQFLGRRKEDGKWECLPWDYDKTFLGGVTRTAWLTNPLFDRLRAESPEFEKTLRQRWGMHRAGPLSDERMLAWIERQHAFLAPYMEEELRLLQPAGTKGGYDDQIRAFRDEVIFRLHQLDQRMGL